MATGLEEIETMMRQLLIQSGELRQEMGELRQEMKQEMRLQSGELRQELGELRQELRQEMRQIFEEKLNIGENQSVDLPKMERQVDNLHSVVPEAVIRNAIFDPPL
jgi:dsDNA-specific endonuclease/ATPase MutS2